MSETQLTMPGIPAPPRPDVTDEIIAAAVEKVALSTSLDASDILREYSYPMDGFRLAKELIRDHIDVDRDDIDELDNIDYEVRSRVDEQVREWVKQHNIQPPLPIGAKVTFRRYCEFTIEEIDFENAQYRLKLVGQDDEATGYRRHIVDYEDVTPVPLAEVGVGQ